VIKLTEEIENQFIQLGEKQGVYLEGNIIKVINDENANFKTYLEQAQIKDADNRKKRLEITKQIQDKNKELTEKQTENDALMLQLQEALNKAEQAKNNALNDLSVLQKRSQTELIGEIVKIALLVIVGVGIVVTGMYLYSMATNSTETTLIGNTWSNLFGILLTNSFSIIGTIMGVKYADSKEGKGNG